MKLAVVLGTRPEVIKLAPVILEARKRGIQVTVVHTGQHMELTASLLKFFGIQPDYNLNAMLEKPSLTQLSQRVPEKIDATLGAERPDYLLVQGDTTSAFIGAYWAFCKQIKVAHVEAGLRTWDLASPFPEEANRQLIGRIADVHFAPTTASDEALRLENVPAHKVHMVGNTSIDALNYSLARIDEGAVADEDLLPQDILEFTKGMRVIGVTAHRRENHGAPLERICDAILEIVESHPENCVVFPVHPNPNVRAVVNSRLHNHPRVRLCDPLGYIAFIQPMKISHVLITDSGGVQEEAPSLRKPILVIRESTERPEGVQAGFAQLVGADKDLIVAKAKEALEIGCQVEGPNPYGDGTSAEKILNVLEGRV